MDILATLLFSFTLLLFSAIKGIYIGYPLLCVLIAINLVLLRRGFSIQSLGKMGIAGSRKALPVFTILLMIGAVTATWMAAGTVPAIVYYGVGLINPHWFVLAAFVLTSLMSLLIGTSFGAASTVGLALMIMAKGSGVNPDLIAGAVIAGAYFGDRCSPMSSSAHLVATITKTDLYANLKAILRTGLWPFGISCFVYLGLSWLHPVALTDPFLRGELLKFFDIQSVVLLPALVIVGLALLRVDVKLAMLLSIGAAVWLATLYQHYSLWQVLKFALLGFELDVETPIQSILLGGGIWSMAKVCLIVLISTTLSGMLAGTRVLPELIRRLQPGRLQSGPAQSTSTVAASCTHQSEDTNPIAPTAVSVADSENPYKASLPRSQNFLYTTCIGALAAAFGCTQTIGILLTEELVRPNYSSSEQLALDLENTVVVLAPLVPWNIASLVPATILMTDWGFIPYAVYLYLIPALVLLRFRFELAG